jgi:hypothetical protein
MELKEYLLDLDEMKTGFILGFSTMFYLLFDNSLSGGGDSAIVIFLCELQVLCHDGDSLRVDGVFKRLLQQVDDVFFRSFLQCFIGYWFETTTYILRDFLDQSSKRQLWYQQFGCFLELKNFSKSDDARSVTFWCHDEHDVDFEV